MVTAIALAVVLLCWASTAGVASTVSSRFYNRWSARTLCGWILVYIFLSNHPPFNQVGMRLLMRHLSLPHIRQKPTDGASSKRQAYLQVMTRLANEHESTSF